MKKRKNHKYGRHHVRRLMRLIRLVPIYQKPNTSKAAKGHKTYPYLLKGLRVSRPNQVWAADITYLPMRKGFLYLAAIMDWHTRKVDLHRFRSGLLRAILAIKETEYGSDTQRRVQAGCGSHCAN